MSESGEGRTEIVCFGVVDEQSRRFCGSEFHVVGAEMRNGVVPIISRDNIGIFFAVCSARIGLLNGFRSNLRDVKVKVWTLAIAPLT